MLPTVLDLSQSHQFQERKRKNRKKSEHRKKAASEHRKRRVCIIFQSLGGSPVDWEYNPEIFGIPQIDNIDQETLLLFTSHTDKSYLRDLLSCKCFVGEAEVLVQNQKPLILISLYVIYIILSPWIEIRPLSLTSNLPLQMFNKSSYPTPPPYSALWFKFRPRPINIRTPPPDNYCTVPNSMPALPTRSSASVFSVQSANPVAL